MESSIDYTLLDNKFNAQFLVNNKVAIDASIWHYYDSIKHSYTPKTFKQIGTYYSEGLDLIKKGKLTDNWISEVEQKRIPLKTKNLSTEIKAIKLIHRSQFRFKLSKYYYSQEMFGKSIIHWILETPVRIKNLFKIFYKKLT